MTPYPIPLTALDDRLGFVGNAGSGKTYVAGTAVERLLKSRSRTVIVDPLGAWWGMALAKNGKGPSPFRAKSRLVIFGGPRGDLSLTENSGAVIGETVARMSQSCIIDLSDGFSTAAAERRFMLAFLTALYRRKTRDPLHLIFDEADMWAPQRVLDKEGESNKLLSIMETICRRGRIKGFIPWIITQRPAVVSKNVLQLDGMLAFKLTSPRDRNAIGDWVKGQAEGVEQWEQMRADMAKLPVGTGVAWLPNRDIFKTAHFPEKITFDSSQAPKRGQRMKRAKALKPVNLAKLQSQLASVEAEVKANDPAALKKQIADLKAQLLRKPTVTAVSDPKAGYSDGRKAGADAMKREAIKAANAHVAQTLAGVKGIFSDALTKLDALIMKSQKPIKNIELQSPPTPPSRPVASPKEGWTTSAVDGRFIAVKNGRPVERDEDGKVVGKGERIVMIAVAQYPNGVSRDQITALTGYKRSTRDAYVSRLAAGGFVNIGDTITPTQAGISMLGSDYEPLPTGVALQEYWQKRLPVGECKVFSTVLAQYPKAVDRDSITEITGYKRSTRDAYISRLVNCRIVTAGSDGIRASDDLF